MKFTKQGDWLVSTPVYVGTADQVAHAARCKHEAWVELVGAGQPERIAIVEHCRDCCASRARQKA